MVDISQLSENELAQEIAKYERSIDILREGRYVAGGLINDQVMPIGIWGGTWGNDYFSYYVVGSPDEHNVGTEHSAEAINVQLLPVLTELKTELTKRQQQVQVFTYNYSSIYGTFTTTAETEAKAYAKFQEWLKQQVTPPIVTPPIVTPPIVTPPIVTPPIVTPPIVTPPVIDSITDNMVTQQLINFNIINGRAVGSIKFAATNNFNPFYYGKNIVNIIQFKDPNGVNILTYVKENRLNFTETERDEVITYDEDMKGNTRATVESFVWSSATAPTPFSKMYSIEISEAEPPKPIQAGFMGAGAIGALAGLILIGFIADHKRDK